MKKILTVFVFVYLLLAAPAYADSAAVYQNFAAKMPDDVQYLLSQGEEWKTVRVAENDNGYVVLLEGASVEKEEVLYLLLQIPRENWQETSGTFWMVSAYQKSFDMPQMMVMNNAVWLQFWNGDGNFLLCCAQPDGKVTERLFPNGVISLSENGAVMFDRENIEIIFWNGSKDTCYPVKVENGGVAAVTELQGNVYYLNHAGELYRVSDVGETRILSLQDIYREQDGTAGTGHYHKEDYLDYKMLFYSNDMLWLGANDATLAGKKFLVQYDGETWNNYEGINVGRYNSSWEQGNRSTCIMLEDWYPVTARPMPGPTSYKRIYTLNDNAVQSVLYQGQPFSYISSNGDVWQYGMDGVLFQCNDTTGNCERFGLIKNQEIRVYYDNTAYLFDVMPYIRENRVLVPVRGIAELLGAEVSWQEGIVTILNDNGCICLDTQKSLVETNGKWRKIDTTIENINGRVMVPIRFVAEALQTEVIWDGVNKMVTLFP